jgi:cytochrome c-type biogenesis protein CcmH
MVFWLIVSVMILVAFAIILPPIWRTYSLNNTDDLDQRNIKIARERLAELKTNYASGGINQAQYEEQEAELELALSDDLSIQKQQAISPTQGRWLVYVLAVVVPCLSIVLYFSLGNFGAITRSRDPAPQEAANMPSQEAINGMVAKLAEKLKGEPNNIEGWQMLGRSYKVLKKYPEAVSALRHAYDLTKDSPDVVLQYAEALMLANNNNWSGKPDELIKKVLVQQPENLNALWFAAMATAQQGDKPSAVKYLRKMVDLLPIDSPDRKELETLIANAGQEPTKTESANPKIADSVDKVTGGVNVQVSLAAALIPQTSPDDTVFVYAQAVSGPKMPLAISKKRVADLPFTVNLSDADAMLPTMKLSQFKQVRLLARVSKTGSAMPVSGDLLGALENAEIARQQNYQIVINDSIK